MRIVPGHALAVCGALIAVVWLPAVSGLVNAGQAELVEAQGSVITVTSVSDDVNGDVSSVARLADSPGADGLSLREAIEATNRDPGMYTIEFAAELDSQVISALPFPPLLAGGVTIDGDIDGDEKPDITIRAASATDNLSALTVSSSDNTLDAIQLDGSWETGVSLSPPTPGETYANTTVANMIITGARNGILLNAPGWPADSRATEHRWVNTHIVDNRIDATFGGVSVGLAKTIGDVVEGLDISDNEIHLGGGGTDPTTAISLAAGFWDGSSANQITDVVISDNTLSGAEGSIVVTTGQVGGRRTGSLGFTSPTTRSTWANPGSSRAEFWSWRTTRRPPGTTRPTPQSPIRMTT